MQFSIEVPDPALTGFSDDAKAELRTAANRYAARVVDQTLAIEEIQRVQGPKVDVNLSHITTAIRLTALIGSPPTRVTIRLVRVLAAVLPLILGVTYDSSKIGSQQAYSLLFALLLTVTIAVTMLSIMKE